MKKLLLTGITLTAVIAGPAMAADLAAPAVVVVPASWTGLYVGVNAGYAWSQNNPVDSVGTPNFANPFLLASTAGLAASVAGVTTSVPVGKSNGFIGGGQIGYNYQFNNIVAGIETDFQGLSSRGSGTTANTLPFPGFPGNVDNTTLTASKSVNWLGTLRGQLGFTITPAVLIYGTGGLASGGVRSSTAIGQQLVGPEMVFINDPYGSVASIGQARVGWAAGAGAAWLVAANWNAKIEYLHYDLGSVTYTGTMSNIAVPPGGTFYNLGATSSTRFSGDIIRVGLNYKFGYAPVVAKY